jgi:carboxymethylenebutenolidase
MNLFQNYLVEEFAEDYQEGHLSRRDALKLIFSVTGSMLVTNSILAACAPPPETALAPTALAPAATAAIPAPSDTPQIAASATTPAEPTEAAVNTADIELPGEGAALLGALSRPAGAEPRPVILVCHENRGLTEHIKDVTRRLASAGYVALAVDLLSRQGGTSSLSSDQVPGTLGNTPPEQFVSDFKSGWHYLQGQSFAKAERVGMLGFCFGGGVTWQVATQMPELLAAVPFYGPHPAVEAVANIQAAVLAIYAGNDQRINQGIPPIEEAMLKNGKVYEKVIYPGVDHAFHNDTSPRYNAEAAQDAWRRTLAWFGKYVS